MTDVVVFDRFDAWESFKRCVEYTGDREYCRKAVELLAEVQARQEFVYGDRPRRRIILPIDMRRHYAMATDKNRRAVVIFVGLDKCSVALFYEKNDNGDFTLKFADWIATELKAMKNLHPVAFTQHL